MDIANLSFRTFAQATEDPVRVEQALRFVSRSEDIKQSTSAGYHGNPIIVMETRVTDSKSIKAIFRSLGREELVRLLESLELRLDEDSFFFFRLDKQEAFLGRVVNGSGEDVIAVRGKVKSYPQNRSNALEVMRKFLQEELDRWDRGQKKD